MTSLTTEQFDRTRRLALQLTGIELSERHRELLTRRSQRIGIRNPAEFDALLGATDTGDAAARRRFIRLLTTNFSGFFRHPQHFHLAAEHALWAVHRRGTARIWSAAASTGEEPYSLAMTLIEVFQRNDPPATIMATDIDEDSLVTARQGEYSAPAMNPLDEGQRKRFFTETTPAGRWRITGAARQLVAFQTLNLADPAWPVTGPFDVVFCRNVLMYLDAGNRYSALERIASLLSTDGILILDPAEHLGSAGHLFSPGTHGVFAGHPQTRRKGLAPVRHAVT